MEVSGDILLARRKYEPYSGTWYFPSGYIEYNESAEEAAIREVREESGLVVELTGIFDVFSVFDDPRQNTVLVLYSANVVGGQLMAGDDASDVRFFSALGFAEQIGFTAHRQAFQKWLESTPRHPPHSNTVLQTTTDVSFNDLNSFSCSRSCAGGR